MNNTYFEIRAAFRFDQEIVAEEALRTFLQKAPVNHYGVKASVHVLEAPPMGRMPVGRYVLRLEAASHPKDGLGFLQLHQGHWDSFKQKLRAVMFRPLAAQDYDSPYALCEVEQPWHLVDLTHI